jgi:uncharacterized protein
MPLLLLTFGVIGHMVLWVALINRIHGLGIKRFWVKLLTLLCLVAFAIIPLLIATALWIRVDRPPLAARSTMDVAWAYVAACAVVCIVAALQRWHWAWHPERAGTPLSNHTTHVRLPDSSSAFTAAGVPTWLSRLPGNEVLKIRAQEKELAILRLASAHDGMRIAHLTDFHMSGRISRAYFAHVVEEVNAAAPDLVAITGDLVEGDKFLDWIAPTLGRLRAPHGVFCVLGNHDRRATESLLKATLAAAGLIHIGGHCRAIVVRGMPLILAGNELPWYKPAADMAGCPPRNSTGGPTRILLSHSPDQFRWAQEHDVDLMLAGHLHGGQVRLPILGAITSPSTQGVRYVAGVFTAGNTVLHVSRGVSALTPLRYRCPPEIALLVLRSARS